MTTERNHIAIVAWFEKLNTFATRLEHDMQSGDYKHCAIYEEELNDLWPRDDDHREAKITQFAKDHGFRLVFYQRDLCAIFDKKPPGNHE